MGDQEAVGGCWTAGQVVYPPGLCHLRMMRDGRQPTNGQQHLQGRRRWKRRTVKERDERIQSRRKDQSDD